MKVKQQRSGTAKSRYQRLKRWIKYKYLQLFRAKGGAAVVARGFSIGLWIEMFTLPTFGLAAVLILPAIYFFRGSLAAALIGFLFGKIIYIPVSFINNKVGRWIVPHDFRKYITFLPNWMEKLLYMNIKLLVGGIIVGALLGVIAYFPVKFLLQFYTERRKEKRRKAKMQELHDHK